MAPVISGRSDEKVKQESIEIVGMDGDQELPDDKEYALRKGVAHVFTATSDVRMRRTCKCAHFLCLLLARVLLRLAASVPRSSWNCWVSK